MGCRPGSLPSSHARLPFPGTHPGERGRGQVREGCARHQPRRSRCGRASPGCGPARAQLERAAASPGCEAKPEHDGTPLATETSCTSPTPFAQCRGGRLAQRCRGQRAGTPRAASLLPTPPVLQRRAACRRRVAPGCPNSACPEVLRPRALPGSVCPKKFGMRQGCEGKSADVPRLHAGIFWGGLVHTRAALPQGCCQLRASSRPVLRRGCWAGPAGPARSHPWHQGSRAEVPRPHFRVQQQGCPCCWRPRSLPSTSCSAASKPRQAFIVWPSPRGSKNRKMNLCVQVRSGFPFLSPSRSAGGLCSGHRAVDARLQEPRAPS